MSKAFAAAGRGFSGTFDTFEEAQAVVETNGNGAVYARVVPSTIFTDIADERGRQDKKWGGPAHDDTHDIFDWTEIIAGLIERAEEPTEGPEGVRRHLVKIAAVAVAALESHDRKTALNDSTQGASSAI